METTFSHDCPVPINIASHNFLKSFFSWTTTTKQFLWWSSLFSCHLERMRGPTCLMYLYTQPSQPETAFRQCLVLTINVVTEPLSSPRVSWICLGWGEQVMSAEWSKYDINCNTVGPTIVLTEMGAKAWGWVHAYTTHPIPCWTWPLSSSHLPSRASTLLQSFRFKCSAPISTRC